jgi:TPR repeat protein
LVQEAADKSGDSGLDLDCPICLHDSSEVEPLQTLSRSAGAATNKPKLPADSGNAGCYSALRMIRSMKREKPSLRRLEQEIRAALSRSLEPDMIDPILDEAERDNAAAEFIVADALESIGNRLEALRWYRRAADQGYRPALERLRRLSSSAA